MQTSLHIWKGWSAALVMDSGIVLANIMYWKLLEATLKFILVDLSPQHRDMRLKKLGLSKLTIEAYLIIK